MSVIFIFLLIAIPMFAAFGIEDWLDEKKGGTYGKVIIKSGRNGGKVGTRN